MTNFEKLKSMTYKELYNFLVLNGMTNSEYCCSSLYAELQSANSIKVIVKFIQVFPRGWGGRCALCAFKGKPCYALCDSGIQGFLEDIWKGYKII